MKDKPGWVERNWEYVFARFYESLSGDTIITRAFYSVEPRDGAFHLYEYKPDKSGCMFRRKYMKKQFDSLEDAKAFAESLYVLKGGKL